MSPKANNKMSKNSQSCSTGNNNQDNTSNNQISYDGTDSNLQLGHYNPTRFFSLANDVALPPLECLLDSPLTAADLSADINLGLHENEPDSWRAQAGQISQRFKEKEVRRQEHIYEFILTEKNHCITLLAMQKIFADGLQKYFQLGASLERMFPRLSDLTEFHLEFLSKLRKRQRENLYVPTIADILLEHFSNDNAKRLKSAYGEFCSRHRDAVEVYKDYFQNDPRFEQFARHCQSNPLLKKKGFPECSLFISQRLTKYPLLIEPLIKTSKEDKDEQCILQETLSLVKDILVEVDAQVAVKEKEDRKLEIYNKIDAKSSTVHRGHKFNKSLILGENRSLKFEGVAMLMQGKAKMQMVSVVVLSDVLFFLQENSQRYTFFTPDNKAGVISLQNMLVREKAGEDSRSIYLISSNPTEPEMFELKVHEPKDKQIWIHSIRQAVQTCPADENDTVSRAEEKDGLSSARQSEIRHLIGLLRQKDIEQALLLEEKMSLQLKLLAAVGIDPPSPPSYRHLVSENVNTNQTSKEVLTAMQEVTHLTSSLYAASTDLSLVGEQIQSSSDAQPMEMPKWENLESGDSKMAEKLLIKKLGAPETNNTMKENCPQESMSTNATALISLDCHQQYTAIVRLSHHVYNLLCTISELITTNESYQSQINSSKTGGEGSLLYRHDQQLEELRNLQDKLSAEKTAWVAARDQEARELEERRMELLKLQEQSRSEEEDIKEQREQLFRTMEMLTSKGLIISPNVGTLPLMRTPPNDDIKDTTAVFHSMRSAGSSTIYPSSHTSSTERRRDSKWNKSAQAKLPINLISTTNQRKISQNEVKQKIPIKLASRLFSNTPPGPVAGNTTQLLPFKLSQEENGRLK